MDGRIYQFENYLLEVGEQRLQKDGKDISLSPKVFELLTVFLAKPGELVTHEELMDAVWEDTFVEDTNLRYCIHSLRKTFDEDFIETVPKRGYRFNADVRSFTQEEFIKMHTSGHVPDKQIAPTETESEPESEDRTPGPFILKPLGIFAVAVITTLTGIVGLYVWQYRGTGKKPAQFATIGVSQFSIIGQPSGDTAGFRNGLNDELVFNLQKIRDAKILPINQVADNSGDLSIPLNIARSQKADQLLIGSCRFEDEIVRINFRVVDVNSGQTLLTRSMSLERKNEVSLETSIATKIAWELSLNFVGLRDEREINGISLSKETRNNYLVSQRIPRENAFNRWKESADLLRKVVEDKPDWALARGKLAEAVVLIKGKLGCPEAVEIAEQTLKIDKNIAVAHYVKGFCAKFEWKWEEAERSLLMGIKSDPQFAPNFVEYGLLLDSQRRFAEADIMFKNLLKLEPFVPYFNSMVCQHYYFDKRFDQAEKYCKFAEVITPGYHIALNQLLQIYIYKGDTKKILDLKYGDAALTDKPSAQYIEALSEGNIEKYLELYLNDRYEELSPIERAAIYIRLGDKEKTFESLKAGLAKPNFDVHRVGADPIFDPLRDDPRFIKLQKDFNLYR